MLPSKRNARCGFAHMIYFASLRPRVCERNRPSTTVTLSVLCQMVLVLRLFNPSSVELGCWVLGQSYSTTKNKLVLVATH